MDQEKYKFSDKSLNKQEAPFLPLHEAIQEGKIDMLIQTFNQRKAILLQKSRAGGSKEDIARWQASIAAIEVACVFLQTLQAAKINVN